MRRSLLLFALVGGLLCIGCASGSSVEDGPTHARPATQSASHKPRQLWLAVASPTDANANGYADTFQVIIYLFPDREVSAIPVWAEGSFEFDLRTPEGETIDRWSFTPEAAQRARQRLAPGPGFSFFLRLAGDQDVRDPVVANLGVTFIHAETGERLVADSAASVRLGGR
ncbi:MAG: hypothetical protein ACIARR_10410 [Phycisphaerales bacterium JB059]